MSKVTLQNTKQQPFLATMYPDYVARYAESQTYDVKHVRGPHGKTVGQKMPHSFQINGFSALELDAAVLRLPQVKKAITSGWLKKVETAGQPKAAAAAAEETTPADPQARLNGGKKNRG